MTTAMAIEFKEYTPSASLETLVDHLITALFGAGKADAPAQRSVGQAIHEARRLRKDGCLDDALAVLARADAARASFEQTRWLYSEWMELVRRRFGRRRVFVYSQGEGRAAALEQIERGDLEVVAVLGMKWRRGKIVSQRSLRGLRPLNGTAA